MKNAKLKATERREASWSAAALRRFLAALCVFVASCEIVTGQTNYFGVYSDSNYNILPGYTIPIAQVTGGTNGFTNYVTLAQFAAGTNTVATNSAAANTNITTTLTALATALLPAYPILTNGYGGLTLGGTNNAIGVTSPLMDNAVILSGKSNSIVSYAISPAIVGGTFNEIAGSSYAATIGGFQNTLQSPAGFMGGGEDGLIFVGNYDAIVGGISNIVADGSSDFIAAGRYNTIGQEYGYRGIYDGPFQADNCFAAGSGAWPIYSGSFIWSDYEGLNSTIRNTATNQFIIRASNGVGINTNNPGTNALVVSGSVDIEPGNLTLGGVSVYTLFSPVGTSNGLSATWNYNLTATSNGLAAFMVGVSNNVVTTSNLVETTSNALRTVIVATSNAFAASISPIKAFTATLPATYSSQGIAFNTPLMPDGNYSVSLLPQDANTAGAPAAGLPWYVGSKSASGFTIYIPYSTNAYNLNFDCIVKENTQ